MRVGQVHTVADGVVHIGSSATDDAFIDAFVDAARDGRLRVHQPTLETMRNIQALAESLDYQGWWQLGIGRDTADLILLEVD